MRSRTFCFWMAGLGVLACSEVVEVLTPPANPGSAGSAPDSGPDGASGGTGNGIDDAGSDVAMRDGDPFPGQAGSGGAEALSGVSVDAGDAHTCAVAGGGLYCWGAGARGRLGLGDTMDRLGPARVNQRDDWLQVTAAKEHSCALRSDGAVHCFGANDTGQLGVPGMTEATAPVAVVLPYPAELVVAEANTTCALLQGGRLYCWGENVEGQLGLGDTYPGENAFEPVPVGATSDGKQNESYTAVDTGQGHVCAVRAPGELYCWGRNTTSHLGQGPGAPVQLRQPTRVGMAADWIFVQGGQNASAGLRQSGEHYAWGGNTFGNLGTGDLDQRDEPTLIDAGTAYGAISIDTFHTCGIGASSALYCWGRNVEGQLGTGDASDQPSPVLVSAGPWRQVAVGRFHTCAVTQTDELSCTGANYNGELGVGDTERRSELSRVVFP